MSLKIIYVKNFLIKDSNLLKLMLVVFGFGSQTFICGFNRQNICSVVVQYLGFCVVKKIYKEQMISLWSVLSTLSSPNPHRHDDRQKIRSNGLKNWDIPLHRKYTEKIDFTLFFSQDSAISYPLIKLVFYHFKHICTANIFNAIFTLFMGVPLSTVISL